MLTKLQYKLQLISGKNIKHHQCGNLNKKKLKPVQNKKQKQETLQHKTT